MSMYVELLSTVLDAGPDELRDASLVDDARDCRERMLVGRLRRGESAYAALASEVAYDRALVNLCAARGIDVDPQRFTHPGQERSRLERELAATGVDLRATGHLRGTCDY